MKLCRNALAFQAIPALDAASFCPSKYLFEDRIHNRSVPLRGATRSQSAKFFEMGISLRAAVFACLAVTSISQAQIVSLSISQEITGDYLSHGCPYRSMALPVLSLRLLRHNAGHALHADVCWCFINDG